MKQKAEILVVEDKKPIRRSLCDVLAHHGYASAAAVDGDRA
jgi:DNA-binding response OmpR family regulator